MRAIAADPAVVLADETTANVDSETAENLLTMMEKLNQTRGVTFLFSTHDPRVMERARRVVRLVDGRLDSDPGQVAKRAGPGRPPWLGPGDMGPVFDAIRF